MTSKAATNVPNKWFLDKDLAILRVLTRRVSTQGRSDDAE